MKETIQKMVGELWNWLWGYWHNVLWLHAVAEELTQINTNIKLKIMNTNKTQAEQLPQDAVCALHMQDTPRKLFK